MNKIVSAFEEEETGQTYWMILEYNLESKRRKRTDKEQWQDE